MGWGFCEGFPSLCPYTQPADILLVPDAPEARFSCATRTLDRLTRNSLSVTRGTREQKKLLTGTSSSSALVELISSAVVSDVPPGECVSGGPMYGASGGPRVDGSTSTFMCSIKRGPCDAYGWNRKFDIILVPVEPVLF